MSVPLNEQPNVVTEEFLRGFLADGYLLEVVCTQTAEKRHNCWHGAWMARAVAEDGRHAMRLVTSRSFHKTREFKTIVGLVSFLAEMGCTAASVPLKEGERERHAASGQLA
ncbi:MAG: hypothetical protein JJU24_11680 [Natronohydrobacter sp.]|nr:hypothetical protein [Natronohydrobacter sp.]